MTLSLIDEVAAHWIMDNGYACWQPSATTQACPAEHHTSSDGTTEITPTAQGDAPPTALLIALPDANALLQDGNIVGIDWDAQAGPDDHRRRPSPDTVAHLARLFALCGSLSAIRLAAEKSHAPQPTEPAPAHAAKTTAPPYEPTPHDATPITASTAPTTAPSGRDLVENVHCKLDDCTAAVDQQA